MTDDGKIVPLPNMRTLEAEAAQWFVRLDGDAVSAETRAAFLAWRNQSDQHREAAARMSHVWRGLDCLEDLNDHAVCAETLEARQSDRNAAPKQVGRRALMAASIALAIGAGVVVALRDAPSSRYAASYQTVIGEQEDIELPDGSAVLLNTNSAIDVIYDQNARKIRLLRGEAFFEVAENPDRPFTVAAHNNVVTAVGTAFSVRLRDDKLDVLVTEGRVALSNAAAEGDVDAPRAASTTVAELAAGEGALFADTVEYVERMAPADVNRKLSWRLGVLAFSGEPLSEVVADITRYTQMRIDIADDDLGALPIAGYFPIGEVDAMFEALEVMADIEVTHVSDRHVELSLAN